MKNVPATERTTTSALGRRLSRPARPLLLRQPDGWPNMLDRFPVVPLTMLIEMMMDAGSSLCPTQTVVGLEHLRAYKWLMVEPAVEITIRARIIDETRVRVAIEGYAECVLNLDVDYPVPRCSTTERPFRLKKNPCPVTNFIRTVGCFTDSHIRASMR